MATKKVKTNKKQIKQKSIEQNFDSSVFTYKPIEVAEYVANPRQDWKTEGENLIFIIDMDPDNDQVTNELASPKIAKAFNEYFRQKNKVLIFTSNSRFEVLHSYVVDVIGLEVGYLVCNGGACAYDIANKQMLFTSELDNSDKTMIAHTVQMQTLLALASASMSDLLMSSNYILTKKLAEHSYIVRKSTNDYSTFNSFILYNKLLSFLCYESDVQQLFAKYRIFKSLEDSWNISVSNINNKWFMITRKGYTKINAVYRILDSLHHMDVRNVGYFSLNAFNADLWWFAKDNHFISSDCLIANQKFFPHSFQGEDSFFSSERLKDIFLYIFSQLNSKIIKVKDKARVIKDVKE